VLASAENRTLPSPFPLLPDVTVNQDSLLTAVQAHPAPAPTLTVAVPPAAANVWLLGSISNWHCAPDCVTRTLTPFSEIWPDRLLVAGFGAV
jgi:hypothetical protein